MGREDKGLSRAQGNGFGRRAGPLAILSVSLQALEGCGEKDAVVVRQSQAPVDPHMPWEMEQSCGGSVEFGL